MKTAKGKLSESRDLISTGRKDVTASKRRGKRDEDGNRPTTSKALVIRNGKYGAHGSGEVILASKMSGREKLDLLAGACCWMSARRSVVSTDAPFQRTTPRNGTRPL